MRKTRRERIAEYAERGGLVSVYDGHGRLVEQRAADPDRDGGTVDYSVRTEQLRDIAGETDELVSKHRRGCSNEVLASIAYEAFKESCSAWNISDSRGEFRRAFPELALYRGL